MPEALVAVPSLQMPSENSSGMENTSSTTEVTDSSSRNDSNTNRQLGMGKKKTIEFRSKNKLRKSLGKRHGNSQQKTRNALQLKSHIPRALIFSPSSSFTSLTTSDSLPSPLAPIVKTLNAGKPLEADNNKVISTNLVRQKTGIIIAFHQRKSVSQMDFKHVRRQINFPIPSSPVHNKDNRLNDKSLISTSCGENMIVAHSRMFDQHNYYYGMQGPDPQMAGMRIFATIMLNAWRKRRDEVKKLMEELSDLKRAAIKTKNQLHVFNSLFRVEQKRNDELNCQLKKSLEDINITKSSCESLTTSLISLKADKALLEQQLQIKEQEFESLNILLTQTKSDLFKSMTVQRELQATLSMEQRKIQTLENQKNELINEICELNNEAVLKQNDLRKEIELKASESDKIKNDLKEAEKQIKALNRLKGEQLCESKSREESMEQEIEMLRNELKMMHKCFEKSLGNRLKNYWHNSLNYQKVTLQMLHWFAYYMLPATPAPKINTFPISLSIDKAVGGIVRC